MSDGSRLRQSWSAALAAAETNFRQLLTSSSADWRRLTHSVDASPGRKGKMRASAIPELADVVVHRKPSKGGDDVYRLVLDVPISEETLSLEPWKAVLTTPELRQEWDPAVEEAHLLEMFDTVTRISKTNFTLGWPANPRDAVTISRLYHDATTVIDVTTSLPRSPDEPAYLRPSPPFVRSHIPLFAWSIQLLQPQTISNAGADTNKKKVSQTERIRMTCFWQHDLKSLWGLGTSSNLTQQLSTMTLGLLKTVIKRGSRVPKLVGYGNGVSIERIRFQVDREALNIEYAIVPEDDDHSRHIQLTSGASELQSIREQRRLTRSIECILPSIEGWDVRVTTKASSEEVENLPWTAHAIRCSSPASSQSPSIPSDQIVLRFIHAALIDDHSVLKVGVTIEISGPSSGLRLNGLPQVIQDVEDRDPSSYFISEQMLRDVSSAADLSLHTTSSLGTVNSANSLETRHPLVRTPTERSAVADKSVLSRVRRNYIYFSSLLQEPEAKWRRTTEGRGVSITQLDSIDPTLVVYRAEATFVGVSLWDLYAVVTSPGAKLFWDKQHEDAVLLEDVNELTELWHYKSRPAWPVNGRDAVVLKTVYKSPTSIHVFSFSTDEPHLFPSIPPVEPNVIRTQVDLQGWAIEALSPTTTLLTLLEQSDPKGWTNKTSIPLQMINNLAGIGEFAIKCGGPPIMTRLAGAKANELRYDHERSSFRVEYEASTSRRVSPMNESSPSDDDNVTSPAIECEIRCDIDTWAQSLDIVVDPPPLSISCLRRHRLSSEGGGLWITLIHEALFVDDDRLLAIVRRAPGKEKGLVMVNGAKVSIDVEEIPEQEIKMLAKQKRVKPPRIPLDLPPVMGVIRRRKAEWDADPDGKQGTRINTTGNGLSTWASAPRIPSPLTRLFNYAVDQATTTTQQAVAAISPAAAVGGTSLPSSQKLPMQYALDALAWTQETHAQFPSTGWQLVSDKGLPIHKKLAPEICPVIPVHKGFKVIERVSADELAAIITEPDLQKRWNDRYDSSFVLESFGGKACTSFLVSKTGFPWRDRGFYVASVMARALAGASVLQRNHSATDVAEQSNGVRNAIFCVSASFSQDSVNQFAPAKYNPYALPIGRVYVDAWILETLDPYTKENYAIPSTRCTRLVAVDYAGAIPAAVNSMINATLPRSILAVESYIKGLSPHPVTRLPAPGLAITDKKVEGHLTTTAWKLRRRDERRTLIKTTYTPGDRVYVTTILITPQPLTIGSPHVPRNGDSGTPTDQTPRPSKLQLGSNPPVRLAEASDSNELEDTTGQNTIFGDTNAISGLPVSPPSSPPLYPLASPHRQRTLSATSPPRHPTTSIRARASSSAFTAKGEVRPPTDLIVGEIVVDSKLYSGGYDVFLKSCMRSSWKAGPVGEYVPLRRLSSDMSSPLASALNAAGTNEDSAAASTYENLLPLAYTIYTIPSSPLHSSGLNEGKSPTRHLLRLSLPTAQYEIPTVQDPLTGELQSAPPMPVWLTDMRDNGAVVEVEIRPRTEGGKGVAGGKVKARVDGKDVAVMDEKGSLTTLGREELLDDRVSKMGILSRIPSESEPLPQELKMPVAIADDLLDHTRADPSAPDPSSAVEETSTISESDGVISRTPSDHQIISPTSASRPHAPHVTSGGLLGFWHAYNNPLSRFSAAGTPVTTATNNPNTNTIPNNQAINTNTLSEGVDMLAATAGPLTPPKNLPGGLGDLDAAMINSPNGGAKRQYTLSTVLVVAIIAFLIGSLLRSLISPADFIYFVSDMKDAEGASSGMREWREIRRLFEVKYIIGGWDFQVAVVRRH